ncbi:uncharacterized protein [Arachis hypogaea]|uniref:uncharacterized protein isoform X1 n=1 Tax=Arachis hypogaea TaxID=3818 RepID=UPI003B211FBF
MEEPERARESELGSRGEKRETRVSHRRFCRSKSCCRRRRTHCRSPPPLLVVLNCCTVVAAVRVTGNMAVITGTTIGVTVISIQRIEFRVLIAEFYGCSIQHQGAVSSPKLLLLHFLN